MKFDRMFSIQILVSSFTILDIDGCLLSTRLKMKNTIELKEKYQSFCRYESGLDLKCGKATKDSHLIQKFVNNKLKQYIIADNDD